MTTPVANLPEFNSALLLTARESDDVVFFDTNAALGTAVQVAVTAGITPAISSIVYGELLRRRPSPKSVAAVDSLLLERGLKVAPFDQQSARCFFALCRELRFDVPPACKRDENKRRCFDRLRFDLAIFAAALATRRLLVTDNSEDFLFFPFTSYWTTTADFHASPHPRPR